jgi:hypothetical protein
MLVSQLPRRPWRAAGAKVKPFRPSADRTASLCPTSPENLLPQHRFSDRLRRNGRVWARDGRIEEQ